MWGKTQNRAGQGKAESGNGGYRTAGQCIEKCKAGLESALIEARIRVLGGHGPTILT